jgi:hypothetical protein
MSRPFAVISIILVLLIISSAPTFAQDEPGSIYGKIMGDLKQVDGVEVTLFHDDEIIDKTVTDEDGKYHFPYLAAGHYDVKAAKPGYRTTIITRTPVSATHDTRNDIYIGRYNNGHMPKEQIVEYFYCNADRYMRHNRSMTSKKHVKYPLKNERGHLPFLD